jgi:TetR/AcrR family transcriptional repressor of nem operon
MKVSKETSAKHRDELLNAASRLFRERGFDKVGIAEIAAAAGLTHGAFYTHFESKEALCAEVIAHASGRSRAALDSRLNWRASVEAYLSPKHVRDRAAGCPFAALGGDVARESETIRTAFSEALERSIEAVAARGSATQARPRAAKRPSKRLPPWWARWCSRAAPRAHDCATRSWVPPGAGCSRCRASELAAR